ncbi:DedA family protein [Salinifilum ghardaiensis]
MDSTVPLAAGSAGIADRINGAMSALGAPGAGAAIALENVFPPLPSEFVLPFAGFAASRGGMSLLAAIVWTTVGSVVGALALYWLGAKLGRERTRALVLRLPLLKESDVDRTEAWFHRHGGKAVFFGRMLPMFRSLVSVPAGVERMPLPLFVLFTAGGSAAWNAAFILLGYRLGASWHLVERYAGAFSRAVVLAAAAALVAFVALRLRRNRAQAEDRTHAEEGAQAGWQPGASAQLPALGEAGEAGGERDERPR